MSALLPGDHEVLRKLHNEVLPWMIAGSRADRQSFVWLALVYSWGGELASALVGLGIGGPLSSLVSSKTPPSGDTWQSVLTSPLGWVGGFALIFWLVLKTAVGRTDAVGRARYARDCRRAMAKHYTELHKAMGNPQPPREIKKVMAGVMLTADAAIDRGVWPLHPPMATATQFPLELGGQIAHIRETFMHQWDPPPERGG